jgi:hypothetical protein
MSSAQHKAARTKSCISICKTGKICHGRKTKGKEVNQALENK